MADNYLEKRYEEVFGAGAAGHSRKRGGPSLNTLLVRNRSTRRFRTDAEVSIEHLRTIVEVNTRIASALNRQTLRFGIVRKEDDPEAYERLRDLYVHGQDWRIPPSSFIVVFSTLPEGRGTGLQLPYDRPQHARGACRGLFRRRPGSRRLHCRPPSAGLSGSG